MGLAANIRNLIYQIEAQFQQIFAVIAVVSVGNSSSYSSQTFHFQVYKVVTVKEDRGIKSEQLHEISQAQNMMDTLFGLNLTSNATSHTIIHLKIGTASGMLTNDILKSKYIAGSNSASIQQVPVFELMVDPAINRSVEMEDRGRLHEVRIRDWSTLGDVGAALFPGICEGNDLVVLFKHNYLFYTNFN